jgi:hypothetical protein
MLIPILMADDAVDADTDTDAVDVNVVNADIVDAERHTYMYMHGEKSRTFDMLKRSL